MDLIQTSFQKSLIFDIGNANTKFGFSSESKPFSIFDTVVRTKLYKFDAIMKTESKHTGKKVTHSCLYKFEVPIKRGMIHSEEDTSVILRHILEEIKAKTLDNIPVFVCDSFNSSAKQRFRFAEILANDFKSSLMYFADQTILSLYGMGKTSGCILDVGHGTTQMACIFDGYKITQCCDALNLGGLDVELKLGKLLERNGTQLNHPSEYSLLRSLKESHCELINFDKKISLNIDQSSNSADLNTKEVKLPDGEIIILDNSRFLAAEVLFQPEVFNCRVYGLHTFAKNTIERADISLKNEFYSDLNIVGGTSNTTNFCNRFEDELKRACPAKTRINVKHRIDHKGYEAWVGAKTVVSSNNYDFSNLWITKNELAEFGEQIFYRKCN